MKNPEQMSHWSSPINFILVAIGFAAGLGNIWRYPFLTYENSGGEFFIAYVVLLFLVGLPLLLIEMALGRKAKGSAPEALAILNKSGSFRFIGFWSILLLLCIMGYLTITLSWSAVLLSASSGAGWTPDIKTFFYDTILRYRENETFILHLYAAAFAIWVTVWIFLRKETRILTSIVTFLTPLPFICLFTLAIHGLFFKGSENGLQEFLTIEWGKLSEIPIWSAALSQVLFSLMIGFSVLFAYSSILKKNTNIYNAAKAVLLGNVLTAFIVGIITYSTIGLFSSEFQLSAEETFVSNPGIAFILFAKAFAQIPLPGNFLAITFFASTIFLSVITFALWIKTIILTVFEYIPHWGHNTLTLLFCSICFALSLPYAGSKGIFYLDIMDHFVVNYGIMIIAFIEIILALWIFGTKNVHIAANEHTNKKGHHWHFSTLKFILPVIFLVVIFTNIKGDFSDYYRSYPSDVLILYGVFPVTFLLLLAIFFGITGRRHHPKSPK